MNADVVFSLQREHDVFSRQRVPRCELEPGLQLEGVGLAVRAHVPGLGNVAVELRRVVHVEPDEPVVDIAHDLARRNLERLGRVHGDDVVEREGDHQRVPRRRSRCGDRERKGKDRGHGSGPEGAAEDRQREVRHRRSNRKGSARKYGGQCIAPRFRHQPAGFSRRDCRWWSRDSAFRARLMEPGGCAKISQAGSSLRGLLSPSARGRFS